jgi:RecA/RadA recombinase
MFQKATKTKARLRFALAGPSGAGKTYSALKIAQQLGKTIAVIDTEHGSASKYANLFDFDVCELADFHPSKYMEAIREAGRAEYDVIVVDSLSHAWFWELNETGKSQNSFTAWGKVRPLERALIDALLSSSAHVIVTMRTKTEWVLTDNPKTGKPTPEKVGTAPIQASGIEYEFDIAGELDINHVLNISKSRCPELTNTTHLNPGENLAQQMLNWLEDGSPMPESGQSKCDRVREARELAGLGADSVKTLIVANFDRSSPAQLASTQVDELIAMIQAMLQPA